MAHKRSVLALPHPYNVGRTVRGLQLGLRDPCLQVGKKSAALCFHTPNGPVSLFAEQTASLQIECVGPGAEWIVPKLPGLFGLNDDKSTFQPTEKLERLERENPGAFLPVFPDLFSQLLKIVLLQLVSYQDGFRNWAALVKRYGNKSPGDSGLMMPPTAETLAKMVYTDLMVCGILPRQARIILRLARLADRIDRAATIGTDTLKRELHSVSGIGEWTIGCLFGSALGQADAVILGDYNLASTVSYFFTGERKADDAKMLELLAPFSGHRYRVVNLLLQAHVRTPRRGPRLPSSRTRLLQDRRRPI